MGSFFTKNNFEKYTYDSTNFFNLDNLKTQARVVDIYDGDTCTCVIKFKNDYYKFNVRLAEIDCPEIKSKDETTKLLAKKARKRLCSLISPDFDNIDEHITRQILRELLNKKVYMIDILCGKFDKYGRLLGHLYKYNSSNRIQELQSFNSILIMEKLAYSYNGQKKLSETDQVEVLGSVTDIVWFK